MLTVVIQVLLHQKEHSHRFLCGTWENVIVFTCRTVFTEQNFLDSVVNNKNVALNSNLLEWETVSTLPCNVLLKHALFFPIKLTCSIAS